MKFKWLNFDNGYYDRPHWYFEFLDKDEMTVGFVNNRPDEDQQLISDEGYELKQENDEEVCNIDQDEVIVSMKLGLDEYSNIVNVQFVLAKLIN